MIRHACDYCGRVRYPFKVMEYCFGIDYHFCSHACFMSWWQMEMISKVAANAAL